MKDPFQDLNQMEFPLIQVQTFVPKLKKDIPAEKKKDDIPFYCGLSSIQCVCKKMQLGSPAAISQCTRNRQYDQWVEKVLKDQSPFRLTQVCPEKKILTKKTISQGLSQRTTDTSPSFIPTSGFNHHQNNFQRKKSVKETSISPEEKIKTRPYKYQSLHHRMIFD